ncbi:MAG: hypothetical protein QOH17_4512 [Pseudonocardiales bacterium]|nr:hypothetical protein [Pseudonocardiales bacterium]
MLDDLSLSVDDRDATVVVDVSGALTLRSAIMLGTALRKQLMDRGRLVVDVTSMSVQWSPALALFATVLAQAGGWPLARLVLVDGAGGVAAAMRAGGWPAEVPLETNRAAGVERLERRPVRIRRTTDLPTGPAGPGYARVLVRAACTDWEISGMNDRCVAVANELVTNAVTHTAGRPLLLLTYQDRGMTVAVRDTSSVLLPAVSVAEQQGSYGLKVIQELSESWGVTPHEDGKTVWALVRPGPEA